MNKTELVANVADKAGLTKKDAEKAVIAVFESIENALQEGDKVQLIGFGTFEAATPAAANPSRSPLPRTLCSRLARPSRIP